MAAKSVVTRPIWLLVPVVLLLLNWLRSPAQVVGSASTQLRLPGLYRLGYSHRAMATRSPRRTCGSSDALLWLLPVQVSSLFIHVWL
jgi:hypothetical protein